ncbi:hypothetical protein [Nocardia alba]|uniref:Uncharacterized protein n=1 Tax=Nocardia alba TaxID=225051 RepID=A0A4R1FS60_9NOCA|nr:hypothetical protein [Nocardia alba]TCJ96442.1 hypothetical protein DFR71_2472 [Nocardia alba]
MSLPTPTIAQFRKAAASSPQQACVMVYRDNHRTLIWDDKLANPVDTATHPVPPEQCLTLDHDQFEALQTAIRTGRPSHGALTISRGSDGRYEFSAAPEYRARAGTARLFFDRHEYTAFVHAVRHHEFERSAFFSPAA